MNISHCSLHSNVMQNLFTFFKIIVALSAYSCVKNSILSIRERFNLGWLDWIFSIVNFYFWEVDSRALIILLICIKFLREYFAAHGTNSYCSFHSLYAFFLPCLFVIFFHEILSKLKIFDALEQFSAHQIFQFKWKKTRLGLGFDFVYNFDQIVFNIMHQLKIRIINNKFIFSWWHLNQG